jgi:hypothetical protein
MKFNVLVELKALASIAFDTTKIRAALSKLDFGA